MRRADHDARDPVGGNTAIIKYVSDGGNDTPDDIRARWRLGRRNHLSTVHQYGIGIGSADVYSYPHTIPGADFPEP
jgi:hypothetical protein